MRMFNSFSLACVVVVLFLACSGSAQVAPELLPDVDYVPESFRVFAAPDVQDAIKWQVATSTKSLSEQELDVLHAWIKQVSGTGRLYALTTLISVGDARSIPHIGQALIESDNRYYALGLGLLGDERATPYLREALERSERPHVQKACMLALRMLGEKDHRSNMVPPKADSDGIIISLEASTNTLFVGGTFMLKAVIKNFAKRPVCLIWSDVFAASYLKVFSTSGEFIIPARLLADYQLGTNSVRRLDVGDEVELVEQCRILVKTPERLEWKELLPPQQVFWLEGNGWAYEIGLYDVGKEIGVQLVVVYEPHAPQWLDLFCVRDDEAVHVRATSNILDLKVSCP